jgi:hypothetical protein
LNAALLMLASAEGHGSLPLPSKRASTLYYILSLLLSGFTATADRQNERHWTHSDTLSHPSPFRYFPYTKGASWLLARSPRSAGTPTTHSEGSWSLHHALNRGGHRSAAIWLTIPRRRDSRLGLGTICTGYGTLPRHARACSWGVPRHARAMRIDTKQGRLWLAGPQDQLSSLRIRSRVPTCFSNGYRKRMAGPMVLGAKLSARVHARVPEPTMDYCAILRCRGFSSNFGSSKKAH